MLAFMRRVFIGSWLGRVLALVIFLSFAAWGVGDFFTGLAGMGAGNVARVAGRSISSDEFGRTYHRGLASAAQNQGIADPSALPFGERRQIAIQAMQQLVFQAVIAQAAGRVGIVVPDQVVREQIFAEKAFLGADGKFDRTLFNQRLQGAGFTEDQLIRIFREQSAAIALIEPIRVGAHAPAELVRRAYAYTAEQRLLDMVTLPFAQIPQPAAPDEATLHRYYDNNKDRFRAPEYRRIKLVLLSPQTVGRSLDISEADERKAYNELITRYQVPEKRSLQLLIVPAQARAEQLAGLWRGGLSWAQLQATAKDATPVALDDATQASIPSPDIGKLAFAASPGIVGAPAKTEAGWVVLRVSKTTPAQNRSFEQVRDELHDTVGAQRANGVLSARVQKLQDAVAGGGLDAIPSDLGAAAAEGTLDAQGLTQAGEPAPLPGSDVVRKAILAQAFSARKGDVPALMQGPENSWYALAVEDVTPEVPLAFVQAADKVRAAWQRDTVRHTDERAAAALYADAQAHGGLSKVAAGRAGLIEGVPVRRGQGNGPVPANLAQIAFSLTPGTSTMLETPDGFVVATVRAIRHPDPAADTLGYGRARDSLDAAMADDVENSYVTALRDRAHPKIDGKAIEQVVGTPSAAGGDTDSSGS
jgi:peptidyl-prolyl cis-trans isomerase D